MELCRIKVCYQRKKVTGRKWRKIIKKKMNRNIEREGRLERKEDVAK